MTAELLYLRNQLIEKVNRRLEIKKSLFSKEMGSRYETNPFSNLPIIK